MGADAKTQSNPPVLAIILLAFGVVGAIGYWFLTREVPKAPPPAATAEAKAYVKHLKLSDVDMKAHASYMSQRLVEITGNITNTGDRAVKIVEVNCVFYDPYGQLVLRQRTPVVRQKSGGLKPGQTKPFRLPFDNLPESWNQALPQVVVAQIEFE